MRRCIQGVLFIISATTTIIVVEFIPKFLFPDIIKSLPSNEGKLFFTFDDGPNPEVTPLILDILDKFNAKATFFCIGENVEKYPYLIDEVLKRGHSIGNHSWDHIDGFKTSLTKYLENVEKASTLINSNLFRPPYGRITPFQYLKLKKKYKIVLWSAAADDWNQNLAPENCIRKVKKNTRSGAIILMHDNVAARERVITALPFLLDYYCKLGYTFEKITG